MVKVNNLDVNFVHDDDLHDDKLNDDDDYAVTMRTAQTQRGSL